MNRCLILIIAFALTGCSFIVDWQARSAAKDRMNSDFEKALRTETAAALGENQSRLEDFVKFVQSHTEIEVEKMTMISEHHYLVSIRMHTISPETRATLLQILRPLDPRATTNFNFSNAVGLIHQKNPELKIESEQKIDLQIQL